MINLLKLSLFLLIFIISSCAGPALRPKSEDLSDALKDLHPIATEKPSYRFEIGDELAVKFFYNSELNEELVVRPDGKISLQLINEIQALGKTPKELSDNIKDKYTPILKMPAVTVIVKRFAGQKIYVGGEVGEPGMIHMNTPLTVLQAIFQSGGFVNTASLKDVVLIRRTSADRPKLYKLDIEEPLNDVLLRPYDMVYVPKSAIASLDLFVEQYIDKLIPISRSVGFSYVYDLQAK